jgi:hypothetical protein
MKTDILIDMLARDAGPAPRALVSRRLSPAAAVGLVTSAVGAIAAFGLIPVSLFTTAVPWIKLAYASALAMAAGWLTGRLSRPAAPTQGARRAVGAVVTGMALIGVASLSLQRPEARLAALLGSSWASCPWSVLLVSLPALAAVLWAVRGLAPTRLRAAGFSAGILAGSLGAFGYALSCPEASPTFVAVWYTLGILLTGGVGAALGQRVLRW